MGLTIRGDHHTTTRRINWSYSTLHQTVRRVALLCCGVPEYLDYGNKLDFLLIFNSRIAGDHLSKSKINEDNLCSFIRRMPEAGYRFPNILFHSDAEGTYTKTGKVNLQTYMSGNSIELLEELKILLGSDILKNKSYEYHQGCIQDFHDLVEDIITNGDGVVYFG